MVRTKNVKKGAAYAWAFARMEAAFDQEFYLECICLAESVISDRLLSYLKAPHLREAVPEHDEKTTLGTLVGSWLKVPGVSRKWRDESDLGAAVSRWKDGRDRAVHSAAKSGPGRATKLPIAFKKDAKKVAKQGRKLARYVVAWHRKTKSEQDKK
jgi:hypothetical protein